MNTNEDWVESLVKAAVKDDDVFNPAFLSGIIFFGASAWERKNMSVRDTEYLFSVRNKWTRFVGPEDEARHLVPGPYVLENGLLWKVLRLYEDTVEAFTVGLRTLPDNRYGSSMAPQFEKNSCRSLVYLLYSCKVWGRSLPSQYHLVSTATTYLDFLSKDVELQ